ncbi:MAG TPA: type II CAAX endopeptidase family protein [Solirubrobacterales bacterium]|nr:type II CAAX endopeptidase family protein [Solirubrobacterales bacterium]
MKRFANDHPVVAFFVGAYAITWTLWLPAVFSSDREGIVAGLFLLGVFGPWLSAALVTRAGGGSAKQWVREIFKFSIARRWYVIALLFPVALIAVASVLMAVLGVDLQTSLLADERLVAFLPTLLFTILINGGPEEPGWRGFALPRLQETRSPVRATAILGPLWAFWHLPLLFVAGEDLDHGLAGGEFALLILWTIIGIAFGYSVFYTYLWNRTRSVVPAVLLHASFNASNGVFLLIPESEQVGGTYAKISIALTGVVLLAAAALVYTTRGRLGLAEGEEPPDSTDAGRISDTEQGSAQGPTRDERLERVGS